MSIVKENKKQKSIQTPVVLNMSKTAHEMVIALAGNPNTGKSTVFNALTGLNQHTGNWPGKTVKRMEGHFTYGERRYRLVDLPGTYSLLSASTDEEIARNFVLFGKPDVTVVVVDATNLERNLNLALQIMQITDRVIVCVNLIDEAERKGIRIDAARLQEDLGIPVVLTAARSGQGLDILQETIAQLSKNLIPVKPFRINYPESLRETVDILSQKIHAYDPKIPNPSWMAVRLLDKDQGIREALLSGHWHTRLLSNDIPVPALTNPDHPGVYEIRSIIDEADSASEKIQTVLHDSLVESLFYDAKRIAGRAVEQTRITRLWENALDRWLTSRFVGIPLMLLVLAVVFYLTIAGANVPSAMLADLLFSVEDFLAAGMNQLGAPWWLTGFLIHGVFRGLAWVVSVMLPPMAIFFPMFTILEDFGYLPRVAFSLDRLFKWSGAHGKQALAMGMGFGCNAAGVIATRIIDSPRERLIAILTNNFVPCNGRWPTLIMLASLFVAASLPAGVASIVAASAIVGITLFGILVTLLVAKFLSTATSLKGESSFFQIELPPYRRPQFFRILYTSLIDRTGLVLWRAVVMAAPAGGLCWVLANVQYDGLSLFAHGAAWLDPLGKTIGLDGIILLAYIIAIPANEIIVPTIIMGYMAAGQMTELDSDIELKALFIQNGWTSLTAISLMFFSLLHYPCSTTTLTIWKETRSVKWTLVSNIMPLAIALAVCFLIAQIGYWLG
ncbi:MAG TPA: ferrous iron transport protein B [bacterium]|nr:ferrous iron transport protein B [bacterium]